MFEETNENNHITVRFDVEVDEQYKADLRSLLKENLFVPRNVEAMKNLMKPSGAFLEKDISLKHPFINILNIKYNNEFIKEIKLIDSYHLNVIYHNNISPNIIILEYDI